ncbi:MAG TPA: 7-cyano-7-deazaguanine synthase QueC [Chloroflexota bacterium]|jgi:7-cyano-7-deazaguanine synthase|nr:7-cyano-7-deazaguanine synthase QueC [Chloroflexota bacterium]
MTDYSLNGSKLARTRQFLHAAVVGAEGMSRLGLVLLSGGLDSTTVAALARRRGYALLALTLDYGQAHRREIAAARQVAAALGIAHQVVEVAFFRELAWYSALTQPARFALPTDRSPEQRAAAIPITYVPLRNTLFIALAAALLESWALHAIEQEGVAPAELEAAVFIAANALDYSGYPDCRPEYYAALAETLRRGSKLGAQYGVPLRVETPLLHLRKAEIVRLAVDVGAPLALTWSCYAGGARPCGQCDSCLLRARGFAEAGIADPALPTDADAPPVPSGS